MHYTASVGPVHCSSVMAARARCLPILTAPIPAALIYACMDMPYVSPVHDHLCAAAACTTASIRDRWREKHRIQLSRKRKKKSIESSDWCGAVKRGATWAHACSHS
jgi:hypothetical protein